MLGLAWRVYDRTPASRSSGSPAVGREFWIAALSAGTVLEFLLIEYFLKI